jgi:hypothetical protein
MQAKKIYAKSIILLISLIFTLVALELLIRWFLPVFDPSGYIKFKFDGNGLCLAENNFKGKLWINTGEYNVAVTINKYGFRDSKDIKDSNYNDIFVVGDSFSFGYGVEENERFSNILENLSGRKVYNISIPGDIDQYIKLLDYAEKNGAKISNLIIGLCMENDLREYSKVIPKDTLSAKTKRFLFTKSALARFVAAKLSSSERLRAYAEQLHLLYAQLETLPVQNYSDDLINQSVDKIVLLSKRYNLLVCIIPSRALWVGSERTRLEQLKIHTSFINALRRNKISVADLRETFEKLPGMPLDYHFKYDGHWNAKGHRIAAQIIYENIMK